MRNWGRFGYQFLSFQFLRCGNVLNNNNNKHFDAAAYIISSNEFYDDAHTVYNHSMHFADSTIQGYAHTPQGYDTVNTSVSDRTHSIAVKISSALERLQSYVYSLQHTLSSVSGSVRSGCTALRYNIEHYSMSRAVYSYVSQAGAMMSLQVTPASSPTSILLKGVARVVNLGLSEQTLATLGRESGMIDRCQPWIEERRRN